MKRYSFRFPGFFVSAFFCAALFLASASGAQAAPARVVVNSDLVIPLKDISPTAIFYAVEIGGRVAEFFAVRAPDDSVRIVVNACQACGPAGFNQNGEYFTCSACGQAFHVSLLEKRKGGCNPIPVGDKNKQIEADRIVLPLALLRQVAASRYAKEKKG